MLPRTSLSISSCLPMILLLWVLVMVIEMQILRYVELFRYVDI